MLAQDDPISIQADLHRIPLLNIQASAQFNGQNDPSQLIHFSNDTCCFHTNRILSLSYGLTP